MEKVCEESPVADPGAVGGAPTAPGSATGDSSQTFSIYTT